MPSPTTSLHPATLRQIETLSTRLTQQAAAAPGRSLIPITSIQPGRHQPRTQFDKEKLEELATSIRAHGVIEALVVNRLADGKYELVAGERRWRAAQLAGLTEVPADLREYQDDDKLADQAFISNIQREDLSLGDEVREVARIVARHGTVKNAVEKIGKSFPWFSKRTRLAEAPDFILAFMDTGRSRDVDGLYELALLAKDDEPRARRLLESYVAADGTGPALRNLVRASQAEKPSRPRRRAGTPRPAPANPVEPANTAPTVEPANTSPAPDALPETMVEEGPPSVAAPRPELRPVPLPVASPDPARPAEGPRTTSLPPLRPAPVTPLELSVSTVEIQGHLLVLHTNMGLIHCRFSPDARAALVQALPELEV